MAFASRITRLSIHSPAVFQLTSFTTVERCLGVRNILSAGEWIDSHVILEAKAMLKSSEQSIQEIADELHFANQSFFGKYFKHHTGFSPKEYRKQ